MEMSTKFEIVPESLPFVVRCWSATY